MDDADIHVCGDDLISIAADGPARAQQIAESLRETGDWLECVAGIDTVVAQFDAASVDINVAVDRLQQDIAAAPHEEEPAAPLIEVPIIYGGASGPDFETLCAAFGLSRDEFIELHTADEYRVDMLGFTPGFAYIGGLDERLDVPRLAEPRQRVPAGSVGIAAGRTGIYALDGPGGWPLIGRTTLTLFDAEASEPFLLQAGMRVRFRASDEPEP